MRTQVGDFDTRWKLLLVIAAFTMVGASFDARERIALHAIAAALVPELQRHRDALADDAAPPPPPGIVFTSHHSLNMLEQALAIRFARQVMEAVKKKK